MMLKFTYLPLVTVMTMAISAYATETVTQSESLDVQPYSERVGESHPEDNYCKDIYFSVVIKKAALESPVFEGIGFYSNFEIENQAQHGSAENMFFKKKQLFIDQDVTLATGEPAAMVSFKGRALCWAGSMSSSIYQSASFKPYAQYNFIDADGVRQIYKNWAPGGDSWVGQKRENGEWKSQDRFENRYLLQ